MECVGLISPNDEFERRAHFRLVPPLATFRKAVGHKMSLPRVAALLTSLFFFSSFAVAEVSAPSCTTSAYQWVRVRGYDSLNLLRHYLIRCIVFRHSTPLAKAHVQSQRI